MVDRAPLNFGPACAETRVLCDRAVFTSLPSTTGEGYRLVASSSGLRAQERAEITGRSPSHGSLCADDEQARGLAISTLASGRVCLWLSRFAGTEHTGRGGGRVWTEVVVTDPADFARVGGHPEPFGRALAAASAETGKPPPMLDRLSVAGPAREAVGATLQARAAALVALPSVAVMLAALAFERSHCVVAAPDPVASLEAALSLLPLALRGGLDVSAGLRFAHSRRVTLCVVDKIDMSTQRATRGHAVELMGVEDLSRRPPGELDPWLRLMARWWKQGRVVEAAGLAAALQEGWAVAEVVEVAALCEAIDREEEEPEALSALLASRAAA